MLNAFSHVLQVLNAFSLYLRVPLTQKRDSKVKAVNKISIWKESKYCFKSNKLVSYFVQYIPTAKIAFHSGYEYKWINSGNATSTLHNLAILCISKQHYNGFVWYARSVRKANKSRVIYTSRHELAPQVATSISSFISRLQLFNRNTFL